MSQNLHMLSLKHRVHAFIARSLNRLNTMLTVRLVPANVYSCTAVLCTCTPCQDSHYRLHFSVPLATIRDPGELLVTGQCQPLIQFCLSSGQDLFVLMSRIAEGCGATGGDNFHFTAAAWTFYQHLLSLLLLWPSARGVRPGSDQSGAGDGKQRPIREQDTPPLSDWPLILLP